MKYKGYTGVVEFDEDSGTLFGHVIGLRDGITFQGDSVAEVIQAFHDSVDDYLEFCAERGENPEKPFSGQFVLRIDPQLHRVMSHAAEERGMSLNALVEEQLRTAFTLPVDVTRREKSSLVEEASPKGAGARSIGDRGRKGTDKGGSGRNESTGPSRR
jgi:predicted HicB family RNase H-like nuclease